MNNHEKEYTQEGRRAPVDYVLPASILLSAILVTATLLYVARTVTSEGGGRGFAQTGTRKPSAVADVPASSRTSLPVVWGDLGERLVKEGVIDTQKFSQLYAQRGGLAIDEEKLLSGADNGKLAISSANANLVLNLLWAFGLANTNSILSKGPMKDPQYGGAGNFASTGGWTLAKGDTMTHYGAHPLVVLTGSQQSLVERVSKNIYRPCCDNSTYFPDCNHGMAMLGLLELMASQGVPEDAMYDAALTVNSYWFPQQYATIRRYAASRGAQISAQQLLGRNYSSASGFRSASLAVPVEPTVPQPAAGNGGGGNGGGGCGV